MSYELKRNLPGLHKGAKLLFDKVHNMYYVCKENYIDYYWFSIKEVEKDTKWFKKSLICILIILSFNEGNTQPVSRLTYTPTYIKLSARNEKFVSNYKFQRSKNNYNWVTQGSPVLPKNSPDSSVYKFQLVKSGIPYWYRIVASCNNQHAPYITKTLYLKSTLK